MTTTELLLIIGFYSVAFAVAVYFTRAKARRATASIAAGAVFGVIGMWSISLGESQGWWRVPRPSTASFYALLLIGFAISCAVTYLVLWRVVRRFGTRGLWLCVLGTAILGPPRDYLIAARFPAWMTFSQGAAPVLADAAVYVLLIVVGYGVMRVVGGAAEQDALSRSIEPATQP